ncbi:MAG TPA: glycosyltransferase family 4 protein [Candidatus Dormibacteraeota bacterium]|jgi:glycosyltransferase involved in cell wall biosynthesis|nr:glycosyltransferase family 4 protein [Candidatus Dormibacteraeota bacterium]
MRIAVYHALPAGGAQRLVTEVVRRSAGTHSYDIFTLDLDGTAPGDRPGGGGAEHRIPVPMPGVQRLTGPTPLRIPGAVARIRAGEREAAARIDAGGYDLCWVHHTEYVQAPFLLRHLTTPALYYVHEPRRQSIEAGAYESPHVRRSAPRRALARSFEEYLRRADRASTAAAPFLACNSHFTAEAVRRAYGRDAWVCHPGVDELAFSPGVATTAEGAEAFVLAVGALHWLKRHELVIDAVARTAAPRPDVVIVYERAVPGYAGLLAERAARAGVRLHLRQGVRDTELVDLYRTALVTVCASRLEPFGLTALESASTGTPVVAVAEGGFRETVTPGQTGWLVEPDAAAIAAAVEDARHGNLSPDAATVRASVVPRFTWDATVSRLHELFERAASEARRR